MKRRFVTTLLATLLVLVTAIPALAGGLFTFEREEESATATITYGDYSLTGSAEYDNEKECGTVSWSFDDSEDDEGAESGGMSTCEE